MRAIMKFNRGMLRMPLHWQLWLLVLITANVITPLFFLDHFEAQVVFGTILVSMGMMTFLSARFGFTRIVGLGHIWWIPMLAFLFTRIGDIPADDFFGLWIRSLFLLNGLSLAIDASDVVRYIAGERSEIVHGL